MVHVLTANRLSTEQRHDGAARRSARMNIVVTGHVDHGKSTIVGRLLADTGSLADGKLEGIARYCERRGQPLEYAFLVDALRDERTQGITIDAARVFFRSSLREYIVLDAPGHVEFLKNMVTGAARASAALLVVDACEGIMENSRRHACLLSLIGLRQVAVVINKMDLVENSEAAFQALVADLQPMLGRMGIAAAHFIPVAARTGDNIVERSDATAWYDGPTVLEALDSFEPEPPSVERSFRMPVQDVYRVTDCGEERRIIAGSVVSGTLTVGDEIVFSPSGKRSRVQTIEAFPRQCPTAEAGDAIGLTLRDHIYVRRGELVSRADESPPHVATRLRVSLFWLGRRPLARGTSYLLKLGTSRLTVRLEEVDRVLDMTDLAVVPNAGCVTRNQVSDCVLALDRPMAFDTAEELIETARFVLVDQHQIRGGGIIREALSASAGVSLAADAVDTRSSLVTAVSADARALRHGHEAAVVVIAGGARHVRDALSAALDARLFAEQRLAYVLDSSSTPAMARDAGGVDSGGGEEWCRRLAVIVPAMLDAGLLLIVPLPELDSRILSTLEKAAGRRDVVIVSIGNSPPNGQQVDLILREATSADDAAELIIADLRDGRAVLFQA